MSDRDQEDERGLAIKTPPVKPFICVFKCRWTGARYVFSYGKEKAS